MKNIGQNKSKLRLFLFILPLVATSLFIVKIFVLDFYRISSASMSPTLLAGDFVVILKIFRLIEKKDIIAFTPPANAAEEGGYEPNSMFIKRVIAVPNDTVSVINDTISVNGLKTVFSAEHTASIFFGEKFIIPSKGEAIELLPESEGFWRPLVEREGHSVRIKNRIVFIDGNPSVEFNLTQNFYFVAGDNGADSYDSRYWGLLPEKSIAGRPFFIYWSVAATDGVRLGRVGMVR